jgi:hypothetical protein
MTTAQQADEIDALRGLMAHYELWGDTQQWDKFGSLFHDDAVVITAHDFFLPEIAIDDDTHAHAIWGCTTTSRPRSSNSTVTGTSATTTSRSTGSGRSSACTPHG